MHLMPFVLLVSAIVFGLLHVSHLTSSAFHNTSPVQPREDKNATALALFHSMLNPLHLLGSIMGECLLT